MTLCAKRKLTTHETTKQKKVIVPNKTNRKDEQLILPNLVVASPKGSRTNVVTQLGVTPFHHFLSNDNTNKKCQNCNARVFHRRKTYDCVEVLAMPCAWILSSQGTCCRKGYDFWSRNWEFVSSWNKNLFAAKLRICSERNQVFAFEHNQVCRERVMRGGLSLAIWQSQVRATNPIWYSTTFLAPPIHLLRPLSTNRLDPRHAIISNYK